MDHRGVNTKTPQACLLARHSVPHRPLRAGTEFCSPPGPRTSSQCWWHFLSPWHPFCSEGGVLPVPSPRPHASFPTLSCARTILLALPLAPAPWRPPSHWVSAPASRSCPHICWLQPPPRLLPPTRLCLGNPGPGASPCLSMPSSPKLWQAKQEQGTERKG